MLSQFANLVLSDLRQDGYCVTIEQVTKHLRTYYNPAFGYEYDQTQIVDDFFASTWQIEDISDEISFIL